MRTDPHEDLKAWLRRYQELQHDADRLWNRVDELRDRITTTRTAQLTGMPHGNSVDADRIGGDLARLEDLEREAAEVQQEATAARREIEGVIRQIHGPHWADRREIMRLRYIDGLKWEDCAEKMFGDNPRFWDSPEAFRRRTFKIHSKTLEELSKFVPLEQGQENNAEREYENEYSSFYSG